MEDIRIATQAEVESIRYSSNYVPASMVVAMGKTLAVIRQATELDPVHFEEGLSDAKKLYFIKNLETHMRLSGMPCYFFNVSAGPEMEHWRKVIENFGGERISIQPDYRYRKVLINGTDNNNEAASPVQPSR